jgi:hypothetical protein
MVWNGLRRDAFEFCDQFNTWLQTHLQTEEGEGMPASALPSADDLHLFATWRQKDLSTEESWLADRMLLWLRIRKQEWGLKHPLLPTMPDIRKSALFERLRSGREPLPTPPPLGLDCPWYAVVEDPGPHRADGWDMNFIPGNWAGFSKIWILRNLYSIEESYGDRRYRITACGRPPYEFWMWFETNPLWQPGPRQTLTVKSTPDKVEYVAQIGEGVWLMQHCALGGGWRDTSNQRMRSDFVLD